MMNVIWAVIDDVCSTRQAQGRRTVQEGSGESTPATVRCCAAASRHEFRCVWWACFVSSSTGSQLRAWSACYMVYDI